MRDIISATLEAFSGIAGNVVTALFDLFLPRQPQTLEEQIVSKIQGQKSLLNSQEDQMVYQAGLIQNQGYELRDRENLLAQRDKEIRYLNDTIRSLEFQLRESSRQERRR
jgi:hypothetical protein